MRWASLCLQSTMTRCFFQESGMQSASNRTMSRLTISRSMSSQYTKRRIGHRSNSTQRLCEMASSPAETRYLNSQLSFHRRALKQCGVKAPRVGRSMSAAPNVAILVKMTVPSDPSRDRDPGVLLTPATEDQTTVILVGGMGREPSEDRVRKVLDIEKRRLADEIDDLPKEQHLTTEIVVEIAAGVEAETAVVVAVEHALIPQPHDQYPMLHPDWIRWKPNCWDETSRPRLPRRHQRERRPGATSPNAVNRNSTLHTGKPPKRRETSPAKFQIAAVGRPCLTTNPTAVTFNSNGIMFLFLFSLHWTAAPLLRDPRPGTAPSAFPFLFPLVS